MTEREEATRELTVHLCALADLAMDLLASNDPARTTNAVHQMKSLVGQINAACQRWRTCV